MDIFLMTIKRMLRIQFKSQARMSLQAPAAAALSISAITEGVIVDGRSFAVGLHKCHRERGNLCHRSTRKVNKRSQTKWTDLTNEARKHNNTQH